MWKNEWWYKDIWRSQINLSDEEIEYYFDILKKEFDELWVRSLGENKKIHPVVRDLTSGEGVPQISYLLRIASYVSDLRGINGFSNVLKGFKSIKNSKSAELELFMAHVLVKSGYDVSFIIPKPKKGKTPDLLVKCDNGEFVVECKFLDNAKGEHWYSSYILELSKIIMEEIPNDWALIFHPEKEYIDIWEYGYPDELVNSYIAAFIDSLIIVNQIKKIKYGFYTHRYVDIYGVGTLLWMRETDDVRSEIHLPQLNHKFLNKRLINNGVSKATDQINASNKPGVAAVFQDKSVPEVYLKDVLCNLFEKNQKQYSNLMGVLVFPAQNILKYIEPILIENPYSAYDLDKFNIKESLYPLLKYK